MVNSDHLRANTTTDDRNDENEKPRVSTQSQNAAAASPPLDPLAATQRRDAGSPPTADCDGGGGGDIEGPSGEMSAPKLEPAWSSSVCCSLPLEKVKGALPLLPAPGPPESKVKQQQSPTRKFLCLYCERTFVCGNLRQKHVQRCHSAKQNRRVSARRNNQFTATPCIYCDKFNASGSSEHTLNDLFAHLVNEHSDKYYGCVPCEERFFNVTLFNDHNAVLHQKIAVESTPQVPCKIEKEEETPTAKETEEEESTIKKVNTRSKRLKTNVISEKSEPLNSNNKKTVKLKELRNKRLTVKTSRIALKRSKRLQAQAKEIESQKKKRDKKLANNPNKPVLNDSSASSSASSSTKTTEKSVNPYPEFDNFYRVKKITDHSIDNLKINSLTFDDVFDKAFFNRIKCNIEENLLHFIEGKLFKNEESESRISNFEKLSNAPQEVQNSNSENYGCELSLNAVTPVAALSLNSQFGEDFEAQIEYGSKPSKKKPPPKRDEVHYKYFTRRKFQASILEQKENRDLSKLDMWTQLVIKRRQQKILDDKKSVKEIQEYNSSEEYKSKQRREELNRILDRRGPFEDLKEEASKKAALEKLNSSSETDINEETFSEVREVLNYVLNKVFELTNEETTQNSAEIVRSSDQREVPEYLNLKRASTLPCDADIDRSDHISLICSSQETENFELPTNQARDKNEMVELTGEWARCRMYICAACGAKMPNMKYLLDHKTMYHQNVWVQHYEFVGNQSELYRHLSIPSLGKVGVIEQTIPCKTWKRSESRKCAKCGKQCNSLGELHRHMLECGEDWTWMLARKKCKYRPFGAKTRRKRRGLTGRIIHPRQKTDPSEKKHYKKIDGPRPKPSDADTIQRMLANLPAKRCRRNIISLQDVLTRRKRKSANNPTVNNSGSTARQTQHVAKRISNKSTSQRDNISSKRRSLRTLNKVLSSRILDTNTNLRVKRKLKVLSDRRLTRRGLLADKVEDVVTDETTLVTNENSIRVTKKNKKLSENSSPEGSKRTSPRISKNVINTISNKKVLSNNLNIKSFFPVKKKKNIKIVEQSNNEAKQDTVEDNTEVKEDKMKKKLKENREECANQNENSAEKTDKITGKKVIQKLVKVLSRRHTRKRSKAPASEEIRQRIEDTTEKLPEKTLSSLFGKVPTNQKSKTRPNVSLNGQKVIKSDKKRKLTRSFRSVIDKVKKLKLTNNIADVENKEIVGVTPSKKELPLPSGVFLETANSEKENDKVVVPLERKENAADNVGPVLIVVNYSDFKENPPIPETIFNLESNNEKQLQAKGELDFDKSIYPSGTEKTENKCEDKETVIKSPQEHEVMNETTSRILEIPVDVNIVKPINIDVNPINIEVNHDISPRPKNVPMVSPNLKGKIKKPSRGLNDCIAMLTSKLQQKEQFLSKIENVFQPPIEPPSNKAPSFQKQECILKIPTFKVSGGSQNLETALDLTKKSQEVPTMSHVPSASHSFINKIDKVIEDVIENKCKEVFTETVNSNWNSVDDVIQKVIDGYGSINDCEIINHSVDETIEFVVKNYVDTSLPVTGTINKKVSNSKKSNGNLTKKLNAKIDSQILLVESKIVETNSDLNKFEEFALNITELNEERDSIIQDVIMNSDSVVEPKTFTVKKAVLNLLTNDPEEPVSIIKDVIDSSTIVKHDILENTSLSEKKPENVLDLSPKEPIVVKNGNLKRSSKKKHLSESLSVETTIEEDNLIPPSVTVNKEIVEETISIAKEPNTSDSETKETPKQKRLKKYLTLQEDALIAEVPSSSSLLSLNKDIAVEENIIIVKELNINDIGTLKEITQKKHLRKRPEKDTLIANVPSLSSSFELNKETLEENISMVKEQNTNDIGTVKDTAQIQNKPEVSTVENDKKINQSDSEDELPLSILVKQDDKSIPLKENLLPQIEESQPETVDNVSIKEPSESEVSSSKNTEIYDLYDQETVLNSGNNDLEEFSMKDSDILHTDVNTTRAESLKTDDAANVEKSKAVLVKISKIKRGKRFGKRSKRKVGKRTLNVKISDDILKEPNTAVNLVNTSTSDNNKNVPNLEVVADTKEPLNKEETHSIATSSVTEPDLTSNLDSSPPLVSVRTVNKQRRKSKSFKKIGKVRNDLFKDFSLVINKKTKRIPPTNIVDDSVCDDNSIGSIAQESCAINKPIAEDVSSTVLDDSMEEMDMEIEEIAVTSEIIERNSVKDDDTVGVVNSEEHSQVEENVPLTTVKRKKILKKRRTKKSRFTRQKHPIRKSTRSQISTHKEDVGQISSEVPNNLSRKSERLSFELISKVQNIEVSSETTVLLEKIDLNLLNTRAVASADVISNEIQEDICLNTSINSVIADLSVVSPSKSRKPRGKLKVQSNKEENSYVACNDSIKDVIPNEIQENMPLDTSISSVMEDAVVVSSKSRRPRGKSKIQSYKEDEEESSYVAIIDSVKDVIPNEIQENVPLETSFNSDMDDKAVASSKSRKPRGKSKIQSYKEDEEKSSYIAINDSIQNVIPNEMQDNMPLDTSINLVTDDTAVVFSNSRKPRGKSNIQSYKEDQEKNSYVTINDSVIDVVPTEIQAKIPLDTSSNSVMDEVAVFSSKSRKPRGKSKIQSYQKDEEENSYVANSDSGTDDIPNEIQEKIPLNTSNKSVMDDIALVSSKSRKPRGRSKIQSYKEDEEENSYATNNDSVTDVIPTEIPEKTPLDTSSNSVMNDIAVVSSKTRKPRGKSKIQSYKEDEEENSYVAINDPVKDVIPNEFQEKIPKDTSVNSVTDDVAVVSSKSRKPRGKSKIQSYKEDEEENSYVTINDSVKDVISTEIQEKITLDTSSNSVMNDIAVVSSKTRKSRGKSKIQSYKEDQEENSDVAINDPVTNVIPNEIEEKISKDTSINSVTDDVAVVSSKSRKPRGKSKIQTYKEDEEENSYVAINDSVTDVIPNEIQEKVPKDTSFNSVIDDMAVVSSNSRKPRGKSKIQSYKEDEEENSYVAINDSLTDVISNKIQEKMSFDTTVIEDLAPPVPSKSRKSRGKSKIQSYKDEEENSYVATSNSVTDVISNEIQENILLDTSVNAVLEELSPLVPSKSRKLRGKLNTLKEDKEENVAVSDSVADVQENVSSDTAIIEDSIIVPSKSRKPRGKSKIESEFSTEEKSISDDVDGAIERPLTICDQLEDKETMELQQITKTVIETMPISKPKTPKSKHKHSKSRSKSSFQLRKSQDTETDTSNLSELPNTVCNEPPIAEPNFLPLANNSVLTNEKTLIIDIQKIPLDPITLHTCTGTVKTKSRKRKGKWRRKPLRSLKSSIEIIQEKAIESTNMEIPSLVSSELPVHDSNGIIKETVPEAIASASLLESSNSFVEKIQLKLPPTKKVKGKMKRKGARSKVQSKENTNTQEIETTALDVFEKIDHPTIDLNQLPIENSNELPIVDSATVETQKDDLLIDDSTESLVQDSSITTSTSSILTPTETYDDMLPSLRKTRRKKGKRKSLKRVLKIHLTGKLPELSEKTDNSIFNLLDKLPQTEDKVELPESTDVESSTPSTVSTSADTLIDTKPSKNRKAKGKLKRKSVLKPSLNSEENNKNDIMDDTNVEILDTPIDSINHAEFPIDESVPEADLSNSICLEPVNSENPTEVETLPSKEVISNVRKPLRKLKGKRKGGFKRKGKYVKHTNMNTLQEDLSVSKMNEVTANETNSINITQINLDSSSEQQSSKESDSVSFAEVLQDINYEKLNKLETKHTSEDVTPTVESLNSDVVDEKELPDIDFEIPTQEIPTPLDQTVEMQPNQYKFKEPSIEQHNLEIEALKTVLGSIKKSGKKRGKHILPNIEPLTHILSSSDMDIAPVIDEIDKSLEIDDIYDFNEEFEDFDADRSIVKPKKSKSKDKKCNKFDQSVSKVNSVNITEVTDDSKINCNLDSIKTTENVSTRKANRTAKMKALESIHDEAIFELGDNKPVAPSENKKKRSTSPKKKKTLNSIEPACSGKTSTAEDVVKNVDIHVEHLNSSEPLVSTNVSVFNNESIADDNTEIARESDKISETLNIKDSSQLTLNKNDTESIDTSGKELRRSRRGLPKVVSYNENDLIDPLIDALEKKRQSIHNKDHKPVEKLPEATDPAKSKPAQQPQEKLSSEELFDLLKISSTTNENENMFMKTQNSFLSNLDESSSTKDFNDFDNVFENILEKSSLLIRSSSLIAEKDTNNVYEFVVSSPDSPETKSDDIETDAKVNSICEPEEFSLPLGSTVNSSIGGMSIPPTPTPDTKDLFNVTEGKSEKSNYCDICNKYFIRIENLVKHRRTLTHISKLSEIEAKEAAEKAKLEEANKPDTTIKTPTKPLDSFEDINITNILHQSEVQLQPLKVQTTFENNHSLKLADIINDVLNKPSLGGVESEDVNNFSDIILQNTTESQPEYRRCKSLGERKSFESDKVIAPNCNAVSTNNNYFHEAESKTTILEKQISLLENIIENQTGPLNNFIDDISTSPENSNILPLPNKDLKATEEEDDKFIKPTQYDEISENSSANLRSYEDPKQRKTLNRDEELFLECCSLLKSSSEISSFSKKSTKVPKDLDLKLLEDEPDWLENKSLVQPVEEAHEFSDNSRTPTPLGDTFDDEASTSNTISSNWDLKKGKEFEIGKRKSFSVEEEEPELTKELTNFAEIISSTLKNQRRESADETVSVTKANEKEESESSSISDSCKKIITKGARKVFEGLKVSIPTEELDLKKVLNMNNSPIRKPESVEIDIDDSNRPEVNETVSSSTKSPRKSRPIKNSQVGSNVLFKKSKKRSSNNSVTTPVLSVDTKEDHDVYDFEETQDNTEVFTKPDFKQFRTNKKAPAVTKESSDSESKGFNIEAHSTSSISSISVKSVQSSPKNNNPKNATKKKCMIMGRIFKNAAKSKVDEIDEEIRAIPEIDNMEFVEKYVLSCAEHVKNNQEALSAKQKMTEAEMNMLFDQLLGKPDKIDTKPTKSPAKLTKPTETKKKCKGKPRKRPRGNSTSSDDEFNINKQRKRPSKKQPKEEDNCINLEQELRECIGVASRKSQRKCTSGKQNVLVEYWSSDEEAFEAMLESKKIPTDDVKATPEPAVEEKDSDKNLSTALGKEIEMELLGDKKTDAPKKSAQKKKTSSPNKNSKQSKSTVTNSSASRRKRAAAHPLYHWSSSSEDESNNLIEVKPIREDDIDDEDRPVQHGWIVGDSPKKLVTMLALTKGKKSDADCVKEQGRKPRTSNAVS